MNQSKAVAMKRLNERLKSFEPRYSVVIPAGSGITPARITLLATIAASANPDLLTCRPASMALAALRVAQLGLEIGDTAHIVNYGGEATVVVDYKGLVELAMRHPRVRSVSARLHYDGDQFAMQYGTDPRIDHLPDLTPERGECLGAYAVCHLADGAEPIFEYMTVAEIEEIRAGRGGAWDTHWGEMARKTAVRRLMKLVPKSPELVAATVLEDRNDGYVTGPNAVLDHAGLQFAEVEEVEAEDEDEDEDYSLDEEA